MNINPFLDLISTILSLYVFVLIVHIIISWLTAFDIINRYNPFVNKVSYIGFKLTEPVMKPIRRFMPDLGGIDLSPIVVLLAIQLIKGIMYQYFYVY